VNSQAALREAMLREVCQRSKGSEAALIALQEIAAAMKLPLDDARTIAGQLAAKGWVTFRQNIAGGDLSPTIAGVEEAEKMERSLLKRWPGEHPYLFAAAIFFTTTIVSVTISIILNRVADVFFKAHGW
jgi:hypothetical protein